MNLNQILVLISESLIKNYPKENLPQGNENVYIVNWAEFTNRMEMPTSKLKGVISRDDPLQITGVLFRGRYEKKRQGFLKSTLIYILQEIQLTPPMQWKGLNQSLNRHIVEMMSKTSGILIKL
ncbi:LOW QUALITY PROTEIN: hypothetical protein AAY473_039439 [Plecturocebus cupreus]